MVSGDLWAGAEVQVHGLLKYLHRDPDLSVQAVVLNPGALRDRLEADGVTVHLLDENRMGAIRLTANLVRILRRQRPDIVHTHRQKENVLGALAARLASVPVSLRTVHGDSEFLLRPWQLHKRAYRWLDAIAGRYGQRSVVAVSEDLAGKLHGRFPNRLVEVVENGVDVEELGTGAAADDLPGPADAVRVALVGRLAPVKRPELFVEVAARVTAEAPDGSRPVHFFIIGDGPMREAVQSRIAAHGLRERVHVLGFRTDAAACLRRMDLLMVLSDHEGLPTNVLEAMALGVPVVSHAVGGIPSALGDGRFGTLIESQDPARYADTVHALRDSPQVFGDRARAAADTLTERYAMTRVARDYRALYERLLRPGAAADAAQGNAAGKRGRGGQGDP